MSAETSKEFRRYGGRVSQQASVFLAGNLFNAFCSYAFKIVVSRTLGAAAIGVYALGQSLVQILTTFASLGLSKTLARYVAVYQRTDRSGHILGLFLSALAWVAAGTALLGGLLVLLRRPLAEGIFDKPELARYLPLFALLLVLGACNNLLGEYLRGHQEVARRTVISQFILLPLWIGLTLLAFGLGWRLGGYVGAEVMAHAVAFVLLLRVAWRLTPPADEALPKLPPFEPEVRSYSGTMLGLEVISFIGHRVDVLLLGYLLAADQVGIYGNALAAASFVPTLLKAVNSIFGPMISDLHTRGEEDLLQRLFRTTTKWVFGFTFPLVAVLVAFGAPFMGFFGAEFRAGGVVLALLAVGHLVNVGTGSVGNLLVMSGHQRLELQATVASALFTFGLHLVCIPRWGILGAAGALACGLVCANVLRLVMVRRTLGLWAYHHGWLRLCVALGASGGVVWGLWRVRAEVGEVLAMFLALVLSYLTFAAVAWVLCLDEDDRLLLGPLWENVRRRLRPVAGDGKDEASDENPPPR